MDSDAAPIAADNLDLLQDVDLHFTFVLGRSSMTLDQLTELGEQSQIPLDRAAGQPIDVMVNGRLFARGEVVTVSENFGVRLTEIIRPMAVEA
jgi:flagellar motor switch protein FliN/FliY